jgi:CubicO group peptidase (beta-lactamase class C family)
MKSRTVGVHFALVLTACTLALAVAHPSAAQDGLWGGALVSKIDSLAEATLADGPVAALSVGVKRGGDLLLVKGYGLADVENDVTATAETVYRIGSITKQFTAAAVMQLVEAGKIGLDDSVTKFLPNYPMQGHEVTIRHLLTHTSGIKSYTGLESWRPTMTVDLTDEELLDLFKDKEFDFDPGERFLYNNSGFYLLGMIVGVASESTYSEYLDEHLFGPLGLTGSSYCDERRVIRGRAEGYDSVDGELLNDDYLSMNQPGAAGALCSTVPDLLAWTHSLSTGRVVSDASYTQMTTPGTLNDGSATGYAFGLGVGALDGHPRVSHGGGINGFNAMLAHYPEEDLDVVVLSNTAGGHSGQIAELIAKWALGIEIPVVADEPLSAAELVTYSGVYELGPGFELTVSATEGELFAGATGQGTFRLKAQGDHTFIPTFDDDVRVIFCVDGNRATSLVLHQMGNVTEAKRVR